MAGLRKRKSGSQLGASPKSSSSTNNNDRATNYNKAKGGKEICEDEPKKNPFFGIIWTLFGIGVMIYIAQKHASYMKLLHENQLWFSNIQELEREISFRTESGLYYSFYKQLVHTPSFTQGLSDLINDNTTESWRSINILARFNVFQEVVLAFFYRVLSPKSWIPIYFYIDSVFFLHGIQVAAVYLLSWMVCGTWLSGVVSAVFYIMNKIDTTRVYFAIALRESFSIPFLFVQILLICWSLRRRETTIKGWLSWSIFFVTLCFSLCWQFNQFVLLLQAAALFGISLVGYLPQRKMIQLFAIQAASLGVVCVLQNFNTMIIGSFLYSFQLSAIAVMMLSARFQPKCGGRLSIVLNLLRVGASIGIVLFVALLLNTAIKRVISLEADEHVFKFVATKLGFGDPGDFDTLLYLCNGGFTFIGWDFFQRMNAGIVFPLYATGHAVLILLCIIGVFQRWSKPARADDNDDDDNDDDVILSHRSDLVYLTAQAILFGGVALTTMRMKYLWSPLICVLAAVAVSDYEMWRLIMRRVFKVENRADLNARLIQGVAAIATVAITLSMLMPAVYKELENLSEFHDPDTIELMKWINTNTKPDASFTGSMQLLAGVKLCTGRRLTNHPHYEDEGLRKATLELYQMYAKKTPREVHSILKQYGTNYIILEDSICLRSGDDGCGLPYLMDVQNKHVAPTGVTISDLVTTAVPRFCDQIRHGGAEFLKYFRPVFANRTFRVHFVL